eukprot:10701_1
MTTKHTELSKSKSSSITNSNSNVEGKKEKKKTQQVMANISQQTKHKNVDRNGFNTVSVYDIYNTIQYPLSKLFIDIRSKEEYIKSHVNHAIHFPTTVTDKDIKLLFKDKFFFSTVYGYANQEQIDKNEDIKFYNRIQSILFNELNESEHTFYILNTDISTFINKFPFLCVYNDDIYWKAKITIQPKKSKKKKHKPPSNSKPKTKTVNMIDKYYERVNNYEKYPNQIINDTLYLGMLSQATHKILNNLQITHIINVTPTDYNDMSVINNRKYYQIKISDIKQACIADYFEKTFTFINNARNSVPSTDNNESKENDINNYKQNRIFIHCKEGVSRSASIVIAYIMKTHKLSLDKALALVKQKREVVDPNEGFMQQLKLFETNNYCVKPKQH